MTRLGDTAAVRDALTRLRERRAHALGLREQLEEAARRDTVRTEWWSSDPHPYEPFCNETMGLAPPRRLAARPAEVSGATELWLNATEHARASVTWQSGSSYDTTVYELSPELVRGSRFGMSSPGHARLLAVLDVYVGPAGPTLSVGCGSGPAFSASEYLRDPSGRIVAIRVDSAGLPSDLTYELTYGADGELLTVGDGHSVVYARPTRAFAQTGRVLRAKLVERIPAAVGRWSLPEPSYCLSLGFNADSAGEMLPPQLALGLASNRQHFVDRVRRGSPEPDYDAIWNPTLFPDAPSPTPFPLDGWEGEDLLADAREYAAHLVKLGSNLRGEQLLVSVARDLNAIDWSSVLPVTDDFIVYPVDFEAGVWVTYIERAAPPRKLRMLRERGLLGGT